MHKHLVVIGTLSLAMFAGLGCSNKAHEKCLASPPSARSGVT